MKIIVTAAVFDALRHEGLLVPHHSGNPHWYGEERDDGMVICDLKDGEMIRSPHALDEIGLLDDAAA